jgi:4-aminobutyrate aminotransferase/(S)-3-amino-2-methylpropionate transaminase
MSGLPSDIYHLPFPQPGVPIEETLRALALLQQAVVPADRIAAILIEPVQGEGGFHPAPAALLLELRRTCDAHGILLIADEVQSGFARTGRMFAIEHAGVEPDLVAIAKSLAGGLPLSGVIGRAALMDLPEPGALGGTYAGNPLACAAALAVLDVIETEGLCARAERLGARLRGAVEAIARRNDRRPIAHLRGLGAMVGFDIVTPGAEPQPDAAATREVVARAVEAGLLLLSCGAQGNTIRLLPPLTIADAELEVGLARLDEALRP